MEILKAKILDAKDITELYNELREYELSLLEKEVKGMQLNWEPKKTIEEIKRLLRSKDKVVFIAKSDGRTIGFITGGIYRGINYKEGRLDIYVKKIFRGRGVGKKLMRELIEWFSSKGCKTVSSNVYSINKKAKQFYEKLGFKLVSETYRRKI